MVMDKKLEIVERRLLEYARDSGISCALARTIAEEQGLPYKEVGEAADRLGIKIRNCELGCF